MSSLTAEENFINSLTKGAEALPTDEGKSTKGTIEVQPEPAQKPELPDYGTAAAAADQLERVQVVGNLFDEKGESDKAEQKLMAENFEHVAKGDFTSHSLHLRPKMRDKTASLYQPTLLQEVVRLTGRA